MGDGAGGRWSEMHPAALARGPSRAAFRRRRISPFSETGLSPGPAGPAGKNMLLILTCAMYGCSYNAIGAIMFLTLSTIKLYNFLLRKFNGRTGFESLGI